MSKKKKNGTISAYRIVRALLMFNNSIHKIS